MIIESIFCEYYKEKDKSDFSIVQMKSELGDLADHIVLYGAGSAGIAFLYYLREADIFPRFFADGNPDRLGQQCEGLEIIDYRDIPSKLGENALVIVTINTDGVKYCKSFDEALRAGGHEGVHKKLHDAGCKYVIDYTFFRRCRDLFKGDRYNLPACSDVYEMESHEQDICKAYELLSDEKSKEVFEKLVRFRLIDDTVIIPTEPQNKQYFEYEFFSKSDEELFVDCGAYNGISLKTFLQEHNGNLGFYYGIEPDEGNFRILEGFVKTLPENLRDRIKLFNSCVYDSDKELKLYALSSPGSFVADIGTQKACGIRIDDLEGILDDHDKSFEKKDMLIKMNIEGCEIPALKGASKTIKIYKPRLAIAAYHKTHDLWEIPLLIRRLNENYMIHLRSYMNNISFVYYAHIPDNKTT